MAGELEAAEDEGGGEGEDEEGPPGGDEAGRRTVAGGSEAQPVTIGFTSFSRLKSR